MKVYAISDLHADYPQNLHWLEHISAPDWKDSVLLLAGDVSDDLALLESVLARLRKLFAEVMFVPGNHELWLRQEEEGDSLDKFRRVLALCEQLSIRTEPLAVDDLMIVPLFSWYDLSFAEPDRHLMRGWRDFKHCRWPDAVSRPDQLTDYFLGLNESRLGSSGRYLISFSHFLPRIDLMPHGIPPRRRVVYPVLGAPALDVQIRQLGSQLHLYGHSHVNRTVEIDGVRYVNNAFAYPQEQHIARKAMLCIFDSAQDDVYDCHSQVA